jgi:internalin A
VVNRADGELLSATEIREIERTGRCDLSDRGLTALPPEITELTSLHTLELDRNRLTALPPQIGQLTSLKQLSLNDNQLTALPPEITELTSLETLGLSRNGLAALPPEITGLTSLQALGLLGNRLAALPPQIGQLTSLQVLGVDRNELTALPPEIARLTSLRALGLNRNRLTAVPLELTRLTSLKQLWLNGNRLTALPPQIGQLTSLQVLGLGGNQLTALPPQIGQLTSLQVLGLVRNELTALPPEIGQLTSLEGLGVDGNRLTALPRQLAGLLSNGLELGLAGNPLGPVLELFERGTSALASYLHSLEDAVPQYEAKVLLVGEPNAGKTALTAALRNEPFVAGRPATEGIEISPVAVAHPNSGAGMTVRAWDFGGREVLRVTHQLFFTKHALYLVVWKPGQGQERGEVDAWLRLIRLRVSQDARALVVGTHCSGEHHPDLDYASLTRTFPELLGGQFEVDSAAGRGIAELRQAIAADVAALPQMGQLLSPRWITARDEILGLAEAEPLISFERFVGICRRHGVESDQAAALAELLGILGRVIYYGDEEGLRDFVVISPEWLTKAIGYVLADETTRKADGILDHARLGEIWPLDDDGPACPARYHPQLLRLAEKLDVSCRLGEGQHRSLVAQLVPADRPVLPWDFQTPAPQGTRRLAMVCQLAEPVPGLVAWLTVRHHRASTRRHWRDGVFLRHPIAAYASEALIELRTPAELVVEVRAPAPDYFFSVLRDSIEDLLTRRWPGLSYTLHVPCPAPAADGSHCASRIPVNGLLACRAEGGTHYRCGQCRTSHDLSALLTGFFQPVLSLKPELDRLGAQLADVRTGVNELKADAADTADAIRRILRAVTTEVTDCPRLFTLTPADASGSPGPSGLGELGLGQRRYRLVLWCEHPGHWHPWPAASYEIDQPEESILCVAPYATLVFRALQLVAPLASAIGGVILTPGELQHVQDQIQPMTTLIAALPSQEADDQPDLATPGSGHQITLAQGQAWRAVRSLILEHDPGRAFGDLRAVRAPSGEFLWVCPGHYRQYDPGLPDLPTQAS